MESGDVVVPEWFDDWFDNLFPRSEMTLVPSDVFSVLGLPKSSFYSYLEMGDVEGFKVSGRWLIPRPSVRKWLMSAYNLI